MLNRDAMREMEIFTGASPLDTTWYSRWIEECYRRWAPSTASANLEYTQRFLKWLEAMDYIRKSPHRIIRRPKSTRGETKDPITEEEYIRLRDTSAGTLMHGAIVIAYATGMRLSDCCLLQWSAVDLQNMVICTVQQKTKRFEGKATIPFEPGSDLHKLLLEKAALPRQESWPNIPDKGVYYVDPELALVYKRSLGTANRDIQRLWRTAAAKANLPEGKSFHSFRVKMASDLANSDISTALACQITGHADPKVFLKYVKVDVNSLRSALQRVRSEEI